MNFPPKFNEKWSGSGPQETESQNLEELRVGLFIRSQNVRAGRKSGIYLVQCFSIWDYFEGEALGRPDQINFYLFYILGFPWEKYIFISTHLSIYLYQISSIYTYIYYWSWLPLWLSAKESAWNTEDLSSTPGLGRSPGEGNGNPLQYSCLVNSMDRGAWWATVHGVAMSQTEQQHY